MKKKKVKVEKATARQKEMMAALKQRYSDQEILDMFKEGFFELCKERKTTFVDEPYSCVVCGRGGLKFEEISFQEDKDAQIDLTTITCRTCNLVSFWPALKKYINPGQEKEALDLLKKSAEDFEYNYNRRLVRRVIKKKA